jgi:hypothetical protein
MNTMVQSISYTVDAIQLPTEFFDLHSQQPTTQLYPTSVEFTKIYFNIIILFYTDQLHGLYLCIIKCLNIYFQFPTYYTNNRGMW